jgi:FkbM family methyltransferase
LNESLRQNRMLRHALNWWVGHREVRISRGVGAGLRFRAGQSDPAYALGTNELPVQEALARCLQPGDVFFDIGANVGFFTVIGARLVGPTGRVCAFEPVPENADLVRKNAARNGFANVIALEQAVSATSGMGELLLAHYSGGATLSEADIPPDLAGSITVDLVSIDDLVSRQKLPPPTVVKIDVEGAELAVFQGMVQTMMDFGPIIIYEIDDGDEEAFRRKQRACDDFVQNLGYELVPLADSYPGTGWLVSHTVATRKERP